MGRYDEALAKSLATGDHSDLDALFKIRKAMPGVADGQKQQWINVPGKAPHPDPQKYGNTSGEGLEKDSPDDREELDAPTKGPAGKPNADPQKYGNTSGEGLEKTSPDEREQLEVPTVCPQCGKTKGKCTCDPNGSLDSFED